MVVRDGVDGIGYLRPVQFLDHLTVIIRLSLPHIYFQGADDRFLFKDLGFHKSGELRDLPHTGSFGRDKEDKEDITIRTFLCFLCSSIDAVQKLFVKVFGFHKSEELQDLPHTGSCGREGRS